MTISAAVSHFAALLDAPAVQTRLEGSLAEGAASCWAAAPSPAPSIGKISLLPLAAICDQQMKDGLN